MTNPTQDEARPGAGGGAAETREQRATEAPLRDALGIVQSGHLTTCPYRTDRRCTCGAHAAFWRIMHAFAELDRLRAAPPAVAGAGGGADPWRDDARVIEYRRRLRARIETAIRETFGAGVQFTQFDEFLDALCGAVADATARAVPAPAAQVTPDAHMVRGLLACIRAGHYCVEAHADDPGEPHLLDRQDVEAAERIVGLLDSLMPSPVAELPAAAVEAS